MTTVVILGNTCYAHKGFPHDKALIIINISKEHLVVKKKKKKRKKNIMAQESQLDNFWEKEIIKQNMHDCFK